MVSCKVPLGFSMLRVTGLDLARTDDPNFITNIILDAIAKQLGRTFVGGVNVQTDIRQCKRTLPAPPAPTPTPTPGHHAPGTPPSPDTLPTEDKCQCCFFVMKEYGTADFFGDREFHSTITVKTPAVNASIAVDLKIVVKSAKFSRVGGNCQPPECTDEIGQVDLTVEYSGSLTITFSKKIDLGPLGEVEAGVSFAIKCSGTDSESGRCTCSCK